MAKEESRSDQGCFERKQHLWYLDSGCSKQMTRDASKFISISFKQDGHVTYGDNKGKILGKGTIGNENSLFIHDVFYIEGLKHSLLSISQFYDKGYQVTFRTNSNSNDVLLIGKRSNNIYLLDISSSTSIGCLLTKHDESWLWHRRIAHIHINHLNKLVSNELIHGLPKLKFAKEHVCDACQKGKQTRKHFNLKNHVSTSKPLELLHMDLFGPSRTMSLGGNLYALVVADDFSRFTWTLFLHSKKEAYPEFKKLTKRLQNTCCSNIGAIRSDHGGEFKNEKFICFCNKLGIFHNFSAPRTPQQNGVVERKNRSVEELARTILNDSALPKCFWADVVSTACYVMNRVLIRPMLKKTPYELLNGRKPNIGHLKFFGCKCYILNNGKDSLGKFDAKSDKGIFLGYFLSSYAYRC